MAMNAEVKTDWVTELNDPKNKQARGALCKVKTVGGKRRKRQCCMGLLADLLIKRGLITAGWVDSYNDELKLEIVEPVRDSRKSILPTEALELIGLTQSDQDVLTGKNDKGASFKQIAKYVEENL